MIVDQHHAERRLLHGSDANPRRRGRPGTASTGLEEDRVAESIEEVFEGGLGNADEDRSIERPCRRLRAAGRTVRSWRAGYARAPTPPPRGPRPTAGTAPVRSSASIGAAARSSLQHGWDAQRQVDLARQTDALSEPDLREQLVTSMMRFPGEPVSHRIESSVSERSTSRVRSEARRNSARTCMDRASWIDDPPVPLVPTCAGPSA